MNNFQFFKILTWIIYLIYYVDIIYLYHILCGSVIYYNDINLCQIIRGVLASVTVTVFTSLLVVSHGFQTIYI